MVVLLRRGYVTFVVPLACAIGAIVFFIQGRPVGATWWLVLAACVLGWFYVIRRLWRSIRALGGQVTATSAVFDGLSQSIDAASAQQAQQGPVTAVIFDDLQQLQARRDHLRQAKAQRKDARRARRLALLESASVDSWLDARRQARWDAVERRAAAKHRASAEGRAAAQGRVGQGRAGVGHRAGTQHGAETQGRAGRPAAASAGDFGRGQHR